MFVQEVMCQSVEEDLEVQDLEKAIRLSLEEKQLTHNKDCNSQLVRFCLECMHVFSCTLLLFRSNCYGAKCIVIAHDTVTCIPDTSKTV
jgi:hypothetical protein